VDFEGATYLSPQQLRGGGYGKCLFNSNILEAGCHILCLLLPPTGMLGGHEKLIKAEWGRGGEGEA
jgi:hypothetical protein